MSATGRTDCRRPEDHYVTPDWCVRRLLERIDVPDGALILDPCGANGELLSNLRGNSSLSLCAFELRPECEADLVEVAAGGVVIGDFLERSAGLPDGAFDLVITNPPYSLAQPFIETSLRVAKRVAMLLRLNFLAGRSRRDFIASTHPGILVLPNRPSFTGDGTDACEYGWFVFGDEQWTGRWDVLALTPRQEISSWKKRAQVIHDAEANAA